MESKYLFVFDVESTNLFGEGFAVGAVVVDRDGNEIDRFELMSVEGCSKASDWVKNNVIPNLLNMPTCAYNFTLREKFYEFYTKHKDTSEVWSDCSFPVETNFLSEIVRDDNDRQFNMPYPLKDISTIVPVEVDRIDYSGIKGLIKHNPIDDSIASVTALLKYFKNEISVSGYNVDSRHERVHPKPMEDLT